MERDDIQSRWVLMKIIFVTGGVLSGLGKGITSSSIGRLLKSRGIKISAVKMDPYLNYDAGNIDAVEHGEVYVLDDGGEADLDLGNYERFMGLSLTKEHDFTTGQVYSSVIEKERQGFYGGKTVQIIPHITNEIKHRIKKIAADSGADVLLVEVGGTVGDIESMPFLEAARQLGRDLGKDGCMFIHTTLIPIINGEHKTKPTQHSVKELMMIGIKPDVIIGRSPEAMSLSIKEKISLFCDVPVEAVISAVNARSIYEVPLNLEKEGLADHIISKLNLSSGKRDMNEWEQFLNKVLSPSKDVTVALVGKFIVLADLYLSHLESLTYAGAAADCKVNVKFVGSDELMNGDLKNIFGNVHGIIVPGGSGKKDVGGKYAAIKYARENKIPFLGVSSGFQMAAVEIAGNVAGIKGADSVEFNEKCKDPVVFIPSGTKGPRLGSGKVELKAGSRTAELYGKTEIDERFRNLYEVNPKYISKMEKAGWKFTGYSGGNAVVGELEDHPFFVACQFHPQFKTRPERPSPLHQGFVNAAIAFKNGK